MFELTNEEFNSLIIRMRSQFVTSKRGGTRWIPSGILKSDIAIGELSTKIDHNKKTRRNSKIGFKQSQ